MKLSVVLATRNEEENIKACLASVRDIAYEIIVVDENSTDKTREIAEAVGAKVYRDRHEAIFHKSKQKALDLAECDWILQLDADERVSKELSDEIKRVINLPISDLLKRVLVRHERAEGTEGSRDYLASLQNSRKLKLFEKHQRVIERRDGKIGKDTGQVVAFFIPRKNYFLGKPLMHGGVYPDGVIRLVRKGKARFPSKSVHEQMEVDGEVAWLFNDLEHHDSPTFKKYLARMNRYTDLHAEELKENKVPTNPLFLIHYSFFRPFFVFLNLYFRHLGILDGIQGFIWSLFSALHYPLAYFKYWTMEKK